MQGEEAGDAGGAAGRLDRGLYSEFARHVLRVVQPGGSAAQLERGEAAVRRARRVQRELRALHRAPPAPPRPDHADMLDNVENGKFMEFLDARPELLPADMRLDLDSVDIEKSIEHFESMREELESRSDGRAPTDERVKPLRIDEMLLRTELEQCGEAVRRFDSRFSNVEIDERLDSSKRRNLEVEEKLKKLADIVHSINKVIEAKTEILKSDQASETLSSPPAIAGSEVVEQILCQTENLTYNLVNAHLD